MDAMTDEQLAAIEASLAEDAALSEQLDALFRVPIHDFVGAAERRQEDYNALRWKQMDVRARYRTYVPWLLAEVRRLRGELAKFTEPM